MSKLAQISRAKHAFNSDLLVIIINALHLVNYTSVEPRFNEPLFNEVLDIRNDVLRLGQSYSKIYGIELRYNEPRYNEIFDITNIISNIKSTSI